MARDFYPSGANGYDTPSPDDDQRQGAGFALGIRIDIKW